MSKEFVVDGNYEGYVYVGHAVGRFENDLGEKQPFCNLYVLSPVSSYSSEDYSASGFKAEKKKCVSSDVINGLTIGDRVRLFFDDRQRVVMVAVD